MAAVMFGSPHRVPPTTLPGLIGSPGTATVCWQTPYFSAKAMVFDDPSGTLAMVLARSSDCTWFSPPVL